MKKGNSGINILSNPKSLYLRFLSASVLCIALLITGQIFGLTLVKTLEPYYIFVIETAHPDYAARIEYNEDKLKPGIELYVTALKPKSYASQRTVAPGTTIGPTTITVHHTLVPLVIFGTLLIVWPVRSVKEFLILLILLIPGALLVTGVNSPFQMLGTLDTLFKSEAAKVGEAFPSSSYEWMKFTEGGARWMIPILTAILCGWIANKVGRRWASS